MASSNFYLLLRSSKLHILFADDVCRKAQIQCGFPAILPSDKIFDSCLFHCYFDCLDSISSCDLAGYICVLSGILAHRMGNITGESFFLLRYSSVVAAFFLFLMI
jgi:hypothetical protein